MMFTVGFIRNTLSAILATLLCVLAMACNRGSDGRSLAKGVQVYENRYNVRVTGLRKDTEWAPTPGSATLKGTPDTDIVIVAYEVIDSTTNQPADTQFGSFALEDVHGKRYGSEVFISRLRTIGIGVAKGAQLKYFLMSGLRFDIGDMAKQLK
jgi:hypothetical protein